MKVTKKAVKKATKKEAKRTAKTQPKKTEKKDAKPVKPESPEVNLSFNRDDFQRDIAVAADFTEKKASMPVLTHLFLSSDGQGHGKIVATDLEVSWSKIISCKGLKMSRCILAALLLKEVKALPENIREVVLSFKDNVVSINGRCKIFTLSADDFPKLPEAKTWTEVQVDSLVSGLQRVSHAMGESDTKYVLNGAFLDLEKKKVVATDGHRLHYEDIGIRGGKVKSLVIPRKAVALMLKHPYSDIPKLKRENGKSAADRIDQPVSYDLDVFGHKIKVKYKPRVYGKQSIYLIDLEWTGPINDSGFLSDYITLNEVKEKVAENETLKDSLQAMAEKMYMNYHKTILITVSDNLMTYPAAGGEMLIKAINGTFPKYEDLIPRECPIKIKFSAQDFLQNMEGALPLTHDNYAVALKVNGALVIQTKSPERGTYRHQIPCETVGKDKREFGLSFNVKYLISAIKAYSSSQVLLELKAPEKDAKGNDVFHPCLINKKAIIMPLRGGSDEAKK